MKSILILTLLTIPCVAAPLKPTKSFTVKSEAEGLKLQNERGFGDQEPEIKMMNLMMVEGSGLEGMEMNSKAPPKTDHSVVLSATNEQLKVGKNKIQFSILNADQKPIQGLKLQSQVMMTNMDMGTETPAISEVSPGVYEVNAHFTMRGPWAIKILGDTKERMISIEVK